MKLKMKTRKTKFFLELRRRVKDRAFAWFFFNIDYVASIILLQ